MGKRLTLYIVIAMLAGIGVGYALNAAYPAGSKVLADTADVLKLLPEVFLHLIKMILAPLILATLVTGIASMGDSSALGRIGGRALAWFITASLISISLGLVLVNLFQPGVGLNITSAAPVSDLATADFTLRHFVLEVFPTSALDAMAKTTSCRSSSSRSSPGSGCPPWARKARRWCEEQKRWRR